MSYIKLNGIEFDADVAISKYNRNFNVLDGENAGRGHDWPHGTGYYRYIYRTQTDSIPPGVITTTGWTNFWDYLVEHSVDDSVMLRLLMDRPPSPMKLIIQVHLRHRKVERGVNYWGEIEVNFIPMEAQVTPA